MTDSTKQEDGQEQTIEEILTSIRQVISDDTNEGGSTEITTNAGEKTSEEKLKVNEDDVLDLTEIVEESGNLNN